MTQHCNCPTCQKARIIEAARARAEKELLSRWVVIDEIKRTVVEDVSVIHHEAKIITIQERDAKGNVIGVMHVKVAGMRIDRPAFKIYVTFPEDVKAAAPLHRALRKLE